MTPEIIKAREETNHIEELNVINKIHANNFKTLENQLSKFLDLKSVLPGDLISIANDARVERWEYVENLQNYIFNYLSGAKALIDFTRIHYKKYYSKKNQIIGYKEKIKENFIDCSLHNFIQEFRNYVLHYGVPPLSISKSINSLENDKVTHRIEIDKKVLLESNFNWKKTSRDFINSVYWEKFQDIQLLFAEYFETLREFQNWYYLQQKTLFSKYLKEIDDDNLAFQKRIISSVATRINEGKGFTVKAVESMLLGCFNIEEAKEIIALKNQNDRVSDIINRLKEKELFDSKELQSMRILKAIMLSNKQDLKT